MLISANTLSNYMSGFVDGLHCWLVIRADFLVHYLPLCYEKICICWISSIFHTRTHTHTHERVYRFDVLYRFSRVLLNQETDLSLQVISNSKIIKDLLYGSYVWGVVDDARYCRQYPAFNVLGSCRFTTLAMDSWHDGSFWAAICRNLRFGF